MEQSITRGRRGSCLSRAATAAGRPLAITLLAAACLGQSCGSNPLPVEEQIDEQVLGYQPDVAPVVGGTAPPVTVEPPYSILLSASAKSGPAPLQVTFDVAADTAALPDDTEFDWQVGASVMQTQSGSLVQDFRTPGPYTVTVCASSASWPSGVNRCARTSVVALGASGGSVNYEPGAFDAMFTVTENASVDLVLAGADPEGSPLGFEIVSEPLHGTLGHLVVTASDSATVSYSPDTGYTGFDELTFRVNDGETVSLAARVIVQVTPLPTVDDPVVTPEPEPLPIRIVVVPSLHRVWREDTGIQGDSSIDIQCARGESESCQIVVVNYGTEPLRSIDVTCTLDVAGASGSVPIVTPFRVHYAKVRESTSTYKSTLARYSRWEGAGWYPDALIPFADPYTGDALTSGQYLAAGFELPAGRCQPYWLDFTATANTQAGVYQGVVRVTANGYRQEIPVSLKVWDFELPVGSALPTRIGCSTSRVQSIYHTGSDAGRLAELERRHVAQLEAHRVFNISLPSVPYDDATGEIRADSAYLSQVRQTIDAKGLRMCSLTIGNAWPFPDALGTGWEKFKTYMRGIDRMLDQNPWIPPTFVYMVDEPNSELKYNQVYQVGQFLESEGINVLQFVTGALKEREGWAPLQGSVDVWTYHWGSSFDLQAVVTRKTAGDRVWTYTALGNPSDAPSWLLDAPITDYMVPFWASWSQGLDGLLYWTAIIDCQNWGVDPWTNPASLVYSDGQGGSLAMNGEGSLLMPGSPAGVDGPLPTIRLKVIRDGLDCYSLLQLLADLGGREVGDEIARSVANSHREWNSDYRAYLAARIRVAEEILSRQ